MNNWLSNNNEQIEYYLKSNDVILVDRKYQINILLNLIEYYQKNENQLFLDFGCGDGIISKILLSRFPENTIDLLDGSEVMVEKLKLSFTENKTNIIHMDFNNWMNQNIENRYNVIFSSMAIHHLEHIEKNRLFSKIYTALKYGGLFVNIDVVKPSSITVEGFQFEMWQNSIKEKLNSNADEFEKHRNLPSVYKKKSENKPSTLTSQLSMLENIGFEDVDCHYKNGIFVLYSAMKK